MFSALGIEGTVFGSNLAGANEYACKWVFEIANLSSV
jgi:hypothetical protein